MSSSQINQPLRDGYDVAKMSTLKASAVIPYGVMCVNLSGKIQEVAANTASQNVLGVALQPLTETTGADYTLPSPASFARACTVEMLIDQGDAVVDADVGKTVYFTQGDTIHKTNAGNDVACTLVEILSTTRCKVRI